MSKIIDECLNDYRDIHNKINLERNALYDERRNILCKIEYLNNKCDSIYKYDKMMRLYSYFKQKVNTLNEQQQHIYKICETKGSLLFTYEKNINVLKTYKHTISKREDVTDEKVKRLNLSKHAYLRYIERIFGVKVRNVKFKSKKFFTDEFEKHNKLYPYKQMESIILKNIMDRHIEMTKKGINIYKLVSNGVVFVIEKGTIATVYKEK